MESLAEQPLHEQIDRYRRIYNDTATWLAETLDGSMLTTFEYTFDGRELYADDGSPLSDIFLDSLNDAKRLAAERPEFAFEERRRILELEEYGAMIKMCRGELPNTMVVVSDFPPELMHATKDVGGYNVSRKQTMLRVLTWDGSRMRMHSQSLDGSDRQGLESMYKEFNGIPAAGELLGQRVHAELPIDDQPYVTEHLKGVYDRTLTEQYGGRWRAGRREAERNTYQFVLQQHDVLDYFAQQFMHRTPSDDERYNIAALIEKRYGFFGSRNISAASAELVLGGFVAHNLEQQLLLAGDEARAEGKTFSGCGMSVGANDPDAKDQLKSAGYGNKANEDEDKFGSLTFTCPKGHTNRRPRGRLVDACQKCGIDVSCKPPDPIKKIEFFTRKSKEPVPAFG